MSNVSLEAGLSNVILEGDCKVVIDATNSMEENASMLYPMIKDIQILLNHNPNWQIQFTF